MEVLGLGGVFIRAKNIEEMIKWYDLVLGINLETWNGTAFIPTENNMSVFSLFSEESDYFPRTQSFMLNFQIKDMNEFQKHLQNIDIEAARKLEENDFGKFIWLKDPDGNLVEVWER